MRIDWIHLCETVYNYKLPCNHFTATSLWVCFFVYLKMHPKNETTSIHDSTQGLFFSKSIWCRATDQNIEFWIKKMMAAVEIVHVEAPALFPTLPSTQQVFFIRRDVYLLQLAFTLLSYNSTLIIFWQFAYMTV